MNYFIGERAGTLGTPMHIGDDGNGENKEHFSSKVYIYKINLHHSTGTSPTVEWSTSFHLDTPVAES